MILGPTAIQENNDEPPPPSLARLYAGFSVSRRASSPFGAHPTPPSSTPRPLPKKGLAVSNECADRANSTSGDSRLAKDADAASRAPWCPASANVNPRPGPASSGTAWAASEGPGRRKRPAALWYAAAAAHSDAVRPERASPVEVVAGQDGSRAAPHHTTPREERERERSAGVSERRQTRTRATDSQHRRCELHANAALQAMRARAGEGQHAG